jgi:lysophospholipid acyltransferase (LPLAT)-like uncharacterized protein
VAKRLIRHPAAQGALARIVALYLRLVWATTRWTLVGEEHARALADGPMILAFWHERLPLAALGWRLLARRVPQQGGRRAQVLISRHRDGRLIAAAVRPFGIDVVHASSSKGGAAGLRALARILAGGGVAVITPDGPRGPARVAAPGVAQLAALSGVPVLPCAVASSRMRLAGSWDRMRFPLPFARGVAVVGAPVTVAREDAAAAVPAIAAALTAACATADGMVAA